MDKTTEGFIFTLLIGLFVGAIAGYTIAVSVWVEDCKAIGMHAQSGVAYECREKK